METSPSGTRSWRKTGLKARLSVPGQPRIRLYYIPSSKLPYLSVSWGGFFFFDFAGKRKKKFQGLGFISGGQSLSNCLAYKAGNTCTEANSVSLGCQLQWQEHHSALSVVLGFLPITSAAQNANPAPRQRLDSNSGSPEMKTWFVFSRSSQGSPVWVV